MVLLVLFTQLILTAITQVKPGVLGFASNINVGDIVAQSNAQRQSNGLTPLTFNETLADSARRKAAHMFANNYWAHNAPDGTTPWNFFQQVDYAYLYAGENLARDFNDSSAVTQAWMASPTHRDNIMSGRYTEIGVAVVNGVLEGQETTLVVQHFGHPARSKPVITQQAEQTAPQLANVQGEQIEEVQLEVFQQEITQEQEQAETIPNPQVFNEVSQPTEIIEQSQTTTIPIQETTPATTAWLSTFDITKSVNLALVAVIIVALALDAAIIWHKGIMRRSGKGFVHLAFFLLIALIIVLTRSGNIL